MTRETNYLNLAAPPLSLKATKLWALFSANSFFSLELWFSGAKVSLTWELFRNVRSQVPPPRPTEPDPSEGGLSFLFWLCRAFVAAGLSPAVVSGGASPVAAAASHRGGSSRRGARAPGAQAAAVAPRGLSRSAEAESSTDQAHVPCPGR